MQTHKKVITYKDLYRIRKKHADIDETIALTMGSFDVIHLGHAVHFNYCKKQADVLVVGLGSDKTISMLKGASRPIHNQTARARLVACLHDVDYVVVSEEEGLFDLRELAQLLKPDVFVIPESDSQLKERRNYLERLGAKVVVCKRIPPDELKNGVSTTKIIEQLSNED